MANLTIDTSGADDEDALSDFDKSPTTPGGGALAESRLESISTMRQRGDDEEREGDEDELEEREEGEEEGPEEAPLLPPIDFDSEDYKLKQASISDDRKVWEVGRDASQKKIKGGKGGKKGKKGKKKLQLIEVMDIPRMPLSLILLPEMLVKRQVKQ